MHLKGILMGGRAVLIYSTFDGIFIYNVFWLKTLVLISH